MNGGFVVKGGYKPADPPDQHGDVAIVLEAAKTALEAMQSVVKPASEVKTNLSLAGALWQVKKPEA